MVSTIRGIFRKEGRMMRICIIAPRSPRLFSAGIENIVMSLAKEFNKGRNFAEICCIGPESTWSTFKGIHLNEFYQTGFNYSKALREYLEIKDFDVVHVHGINNAVTLVALLAKRKNKLVLSFDSSGSSTFSGKLLKIPFYLLIRLLKKRIDHYICLSEFEKKHFKRILNEPNSKFSVIPFGIDKKELASIKAPIIKGKILSVGRLVKNKGFQHIFPAFRLLLNSDYNRKLEIIGDGPYQERLEGLVTDYELDGFVTFTPEFPYSERRKYLKKLKEAEVFVLLSDYESQGIVVTEAISIGKPVMVNDSTALHDHVGNYGVVGITDVEHYGEITWKLKEMLDKPWKFVPKNNSVISQKETNTRTMEVYEMVKLYEGHE